MTSASLFLVFGLLLGPPVQEPRERRTPVLTPTQPQPGEPAIAPAQIEGERAAAELPVQEDQPEPEPKPEEDQPVQPEDQASEADPASGELPSWQDEPASGGGEPGESTALVDWTAPVDPDFVAPAPGPKPPAKGMALFGPAIGVFGGMALTQLITGLTCVDVYCGTRGWAWRGLGFVTVGLAGGGGWLQGKRIAFDRAQAGEPAKNPIGRRAAGWTMFILGVGGMVTDTVLYHRCYDSARGPYTDLTGFRYTCSPTLSVVTLDLSTLLGAAGLGLALSAESQLRNRAKFDLSLAPWGGRGQAGLSIGGRF